MKFVAKELFSALINLFTTRKFRLVLLSLVLIAAMISISELAVAKLFTQLILHEGSMSKSTFIIFVVVFFLFFGLTRGGHFLQRLYRVRFFDKAFKASKAELAGAKDNWRWSLAFELTNLLSSITQLGVIIMFFAYLNWLFGVFNLLVVLGIFQIYGRLFRNQIEAQRSFVIAKQNKKPISNVIRIGTRIKSGETGILISSVAILLLFALLIYLSYIGDLNKSNAIILFFGLRMQNSIFSNISTALMRFARALTHSE
jgi:hypothetical protein